jgi:hypothetical protein
MTFIPIDVMNTEPQSGGGGLPDGFYIVQVTDASETRPEQNGQFIRRTYMVKVLMGPNASQDCVGRPFPDRIRENDQGWAGRHMELFVACFGSKEAVRQIATQHGGGIPPESLVGRTFIMQCAKGDRYTNVIQRLPYNEENWAACIGGNNTKPQAAAPSPAGGMLVTPQPGMPPQQPAMAPTPMPMAAPVPAPAAFTPPPAMPGAMPGMPAQMPAQAPQPGFVPPPAQPGVPTMPQGAGVPTPPPPPGTPSTGK